MEWPLTAAALVFLVAYAAPILEPGSDPRLADLIVTVAWVAFAVDYFVRVAISDARWRFVRQHPVDLLVIALPVLRPLRLLRLVALLSVLNRYASGGALRGRVVVYIVGSTTLLLLVSSLAVLDAERGREGANIESYGDAACVGHHHHDDGRLRRPFPGHWCWPPDRCCTHAGRDRPARHRYRHARFLPARAGPAG